MATTRRMPAWNLPSSEGKKLASKDLKGQPYVLYAYPKDATPGCTTEACDFRDNLAKLEQAGVRVFGISPDPITSHERFIAKQDLNFPLLSDEDHVLLDKLGAWGPKQFMGRTFDGVTRSTWLVDGDGRIVREWTKVKVKGHVDEVLAAVKELG